MNMNDVWVLVVGDRVWGKGETMKEALTKMRKNGKSSKYLVYIAHKDSYVDDMGSLCYPKDCPPKLIHKVGIKGG